MLLGEYNYTIDEKSRVTVPVKFRQDLGDIFVITKGLDECVCIYSIAEWKNFESKLKLLPLSSEDARKFIRFFTAGAMECTLDKQGRILLPQNLKEYAKLNKDVIFAGISNRVEIWDKDKWLKYINPKEMDLQKIVNHMSQYDI